MSWRDAEATGTQWLGRLAIVGGLIGGLWVGFQKYQAHEDNTAHRESTEPVVEEMTGTVKDIVEELSEQRQADVEQRVSDEKFRNEALGKIGETFEQHGERLVRLEDFDKEQVYFKRAQADLKEVEQERIRKIEETQQRQAERQERAIEALATRPIIVPVPASPPVTP